MRLLRLALAVFALSLAPSFAWAEPRAPKRPRWHTVQPAYGPGNLALTAAFGDAGLFGALRPTMPSARRDARRVSDVLVGALRRSLFVVDAALTTALAHKRSEREWKMAWIHAEAMALTGGVVPQGMGVGVAGAF